jgi:hypothetical protein
MHKQDSFLMHPAWMGLNRWGKQREFSDKDIRSAFADGLCRVFYAVLRALVCTACRDARPTGVQCAQEGIWLDFD